MRVLAVIASVAIAGLAAGALVLYAGWYDISATDQHLRPTYWALDFGMKRSVRARASGIAVPPLDDPALARGGLAIYREHCEQCHGAPGIAPQPFALGMTPTPANLSHTAREWHPAEIFWVVKEGLKMTGMPAWKFRLEEREIWAVVAFMRQMAHLSPRQYAEMKAAPIAAPGDGGEAPDAKRGKQAIHQYACLTCHEIPGMVGANAPVGPPLRGIGRRTMIAGGLPNDPQNLAAWLRDPKRFNPESAMPSLGLTERDARDVAAFLGTLR